MHWAGRLGREKEERGVADLQQANFSFMSATQHHLLKCKFLLFEPSGAKEGDRAASCLMRSDSKGADDASQSLTANGSDST